MMDEDDRQKDGQLPRRGRTENNIASTESLSKMIEDDVDKKDQAKIVRRKVSSRTVLWAQDVQ
jgi:hypothetical protein